MVRFAASMVLFRTIDVRFAASMVLFRTINGAFCSIHGALSHHQRCVLQHSWCSFAPSMLLFRTMNRTH